MPLDELAREVSMFFKRNNYVIADAGEVITFEGNIAPERGTAARWSPSAPPSGCCASGWCAPSRQPGGNAWYALALVSPLSGSYYMENAGRKEQMKVKMVTADDDMTTDIIVEGDVERERMRRDLNLVEKGMVYVKGVLEK